MHIWQRGYFFDCKQQKLAYNYTQHTHHASLRCTLWWVFFVWSLQMTAFDKRALTPDEHLAKLKNRGLNIPDEVRARRYLANISYFRLSAYTRPFYVPNVAEHRFLAETKFDDVLMLYVFDRELRLLLIDAIERLEVALRAQLTNILAERYGSHGYLDPAVFDTRYNHAWLIDKLKEEAQAREVETFLAHYRQKYTAAPLQPPIWMAMELLTFKAVSTLFANLRDEADTKRISQHFGWHHTVLRSWFRSLSDLRNLCAHHMRIWNREFGSYPVVPRKPPKRWPQVPETIASGAHLDVHQTITPQRRLYMQLVVIETLMQVVNPESRWAERLIRLLDAHPQVSRTHMGFPPAWEQEAVWQNAVHAARGVTT
jgi:abortive infection bacteriophage resistance protein